MSKISSASICLNEIEYIDRFFKYVSQLVDEIVIVDGGSTDGTWDRILHWEKLFADTPGMPNVVAIQSKMPPSFAEQRNKSIDAVTGDWILHIDIDELYSNRMTKEWLHLQGDQLPLHIYGLSFPTYYVVGEKQQEYCNEFLDPHVRFFRKLPQIRYQREIHEYLAFVIDPDNPREAYPFQPMRDNGFSVNHLVYVGEIFLLDYGKIKSAEGKKDKWKKMKKFVDQSANAGIPIDEAFYTAEPKPVGVIDPMYLPPKEFLVQ